MDDKEKGKVEKKEKKKRRNSILKENPEGLENETKENVTKTKPRRSLKRVSFADTTSIKEFLANRNALLDWNSTYEEPVVSNSSSSSTITYSNVVSCYDTSDGLTNSTHTNMNQEPSNSVPQSTDLTESHEGVEEFSDFLSRFIGYKPAVDTEENAGEKTIRNSTFMDVTAMDHGPKFQVDDIGAESDMDMTCHMKANMNNSSLDESTSKSHGVTKLSVTSMNMTLALPDTSEDHVRCNTHDTDAKVGYFAKEYTQVRTSESSTYARECIRSVELKVDAGDAEDNMELTRGVKINFMGTTDHMDSTRVVMTDLNDTEDNMELTEPGNHMALTRGMKTNVTDTGTADHMDLTRGVKANADHMELTCGVKTNVTDHMALTRGVKTNVMDNADHMELTRGVKTNIMDTVDHMELTRSMKSNVTDTVDLMELTRGVQTNVTDNADHMELTCGVKTNVTDHMELTRGVKTNVMDTADHMELTRGVKTNIMDTADHMELTCGMKTNVTDTADHMELTCGVKTNVTDHMELTRGVKTNVMDTADHMELTRGVKTNIMDTTDHMELTCGMKTNVTDTADHMELTRGVKTNMGASEDHMELTRGLKTNVTDTADHMKLTRDVKTKMGTSEDHMELTCGVKTNIKGVDDMDFTCLKTGMKKMNDSNYSFGVKSNNTEECMELTSGVSSKHLHTSVEMKSRDSIMASNSTRCLNRTNLACESIETTTAAVPCSGLLTTSSTAQRNENITHVKTPSTILSCNSSKRQNLNLSGNVYLSPNEGSGVFHSSQKSLDRFENQVQAKDNSDYLITMTNSGSDSKVDDDNKDSMSSSVHPVQVEREKINLTQPCALEMKAVNDLSVDIRTQSTDMVHPSLNSDSFSNPCSTSVSSGVFSPVLTDALASVPHESNEIAGLLTAPITNKENHNINVSLVCENFDFGGSSCETRGMISDEGENEPLYMKNNMFVESSLSERKTRGSTVVPFLSAIPSPQKGNMETNNETLLRYEKKESKECVNQPGNEEEKIVLSRLSDKNENLDCDNTSKCPQMKVTGNVSCNASSTRPALDFSTDVLTKPLSDLNSVEQNNINGESIFNSVSAGVEANRTSKVLENSIEQDYNIHPLLAVPSQDGQPWKYSPKRKADVLEEDVEASRTSKILENSIEQDYNIHPLLAVPSQDGQPRKYSPKRKADVLEDDTSPLDRDGAKRSTVSSTVTVSAHQLTVNECHTPNSAEDELIEDIHIDLVDAGNSSQEESMVDDLEEESRKQDNITHTGISKPTKASQSPETDQVQTESTKLKNLVNEIWTSVTTSINIPPLHLNAKDEHEDQSSNEIVLNEPLDIPFLANPTHETGSNTELSSPHRPSDSSELIECKDDQNSETWNIESSRTLSPSPDLEMEYEDNTNDGSCKSCRKVLSGKRNIAGFDITENDGSCVELQLHKRSLKIRLDVTPHDKHTMIMKADWWPKYEEMKNPCGKLAVRTLGHLIASQVDDLISTHLCDLDSHLQNILKAYWRVFDFMNEIFVIQATFITKFTEEGLTVIVSSIKWHMSITLYIKFNSKTTDSYPTFSIEPHVTIGNMSHDTVNEAISSVKDNHCMLFKMIKAVDFAVECRAR